MTTNMDLSILKLVSPHRRSIHLSRFTLENEATHAASQLNSPRGVAGPPSPKWNLPGRTVVDDDMLTIFDQYPAAVPFKWEETPGIPIVGANEDNAKVETSESLGSDSSSNSSMSRSTSSSKVSTDDCSSDKVEEIVHYPTFEFSGIHSTHSELPIVSAGETNDSNNKFADELFSNGQILPLKPPPGLQHLTLETEEGRSFSFSSRSLTSSAGAHRRSFRKDGLKALPFLASPKREQHHNEDFLNTMLGFEDWPKVAHLRVEEEQDSLGIRSKSMSRFSFSFRKKPTTQKEASEGDDIFDQDFGLKGGLRERKPLTSVSSRGIADGYDFKNRKWMLDNSFDYYDSDSDNMADFSVKEDDGKNQPLQFTSGCKDSRNVSPENISPSIESTTEKKKKRTMSRFSSFFRHSQRDKYPRSSSVSPAPVENNVKKLKPTIHQKIEGRSAKPLLKVSFSSQISRSFIRSIRQLRSFEFHTPRFLAVKQ